MVADAGLDPARAAHWRSSITRLEKAAKSRRDALDKTLSTPASWKRRKRLGADQIMGRSSGVGSDQITRKR